MAEIDQKILIEGALVEGSQEADPSGTGGFVTIDLIREGFGNARDQHYYSAELLEREAQKFVGARMFANHLAPEVAKKLNGLPRNIQDLMGRIHEAWVHKLENGLTVIRGKASISQPWLWNMVAHDPQLVEVSINASGRSVKGQKDGRTAKIVEAISNVGSVDWVTKAGAGGKVVALMEAQAEEEGTPVEEQEATAEATPHRVYHHHHHNPSYGPGNHRHTHKHLHPGAVPGETHSHVEVAEPTPDAESPSEDATEAYVPSKHHPHTHVHAGSMGAGHHHHIHHQHHTLVPGETHTHQSEGAETSTDKENAVDAAREADEAPETAAQEPTVTETPTVEPTPAAEPTPEVTEPTAPEPAAVPEVPEAPEVAETPTADEAAEPSEPAEPVDEPSEPDETAQEAEIEHLDEARWIAGAIKHKGQLHRDLGVPEGEKIPIAKLEAAAKQPGKIGKRARLALTLMKMRRHRGPRTATATEADYDWFADGEGTSEAEIESRSTELAEAKLREGVESAVEIAREEFDRKLREKLTENDWAWKRKFGQLEQRHVAAAMIEAADFREATEKALKEEFHDAYYEDRLDESGKVTKSGEELCREAVKAKIKAKRDELREFTSTRISEAGETAESRRAGGQRLNVSGEELPKQAPLDAKIDAALAIPAGKD